MKGVQFYRFKNRVKTQLSKFFGIFGWSIIIFFAIYVLSFVVGIFTVSNLSVDLSKDYITDTVFLSFLEGGMNSFGLFLRYALGILLICLYSIYLNTNTFLLIINIVIIIINGYSLGFNLAIYISIFSFLGTITVIIIFPVFRLATFFLYSILVSITTKKQRELKDFGKICYKEMCNYKVSTLYTILVFSMILLTLIMCLALEIVRATTIV